MMTWARYLRHGFYIYLLIFSWLQLKRLNLQVFFLFDLSPLRDSFLFFYFGFRMIFLFELIFRGFDSLYFFLLASWCALTRIVGAIAVTFLQSSWRTLLIFSSYRHRGFLFCVLVRLFKHLLFVEILFRAQRCFWLLGVARLGLDCEFFIFFKLDFLLWQSFGLNIFFLWFANWFIHHMIIWIGASSFDCLRMQLRSIFRDFLLVFLRAFLWIWELIV